MSSFQTRWQGQSFVLTGDLPRWNQAFFDGFVQAAGGVARADIDPEINFLVIGKDGNRDLEKKARALNGQGASIRILTGEQFLDLAFITRDELIALWNGGPLGINLWNQWHNAKFARALPDLKGTSFAGAKMSRLALWDAPRGADFRQAELNAATNLHMLECILDETSLKEASIYGLRNCSAIDANLADSRVTHQFVSLAECDFTRANLERAAWHACAADQSVFKQADLTRANLSYASLKKCDFSHAILTNAFLYKAALDAANLKEANFRNSHLDTASLRDANLTCTDFRGANLFSADLQGAVIDGADFTGANLYQANLSGLDLSKARGMTPASFSGAIGPSLDELAKVVRKATTFKTTAKIKLLETEVDLEIDWWGDESFKWIVGQHDFDGRNIGLGPTFIELAGHFAHGALQVGSIVAKADKAPMRAQELRILTVKAWCEAFGLPVPVLQMQEQSPPVKEPAKAVRQKWLQKLRAGGRHAILQWNEEAGIIKEQLKNLNGADLSGCNLEEIWLVEFSLKEANLEHAKLRLATLTRAKLNGANLTGAILESAICEGANLSKADLRQANCKGIDLTSANLKLTLCQQTDFSNAGLECADLRGADLSTAILDNAQVDYARFDETTIFPAGFAHAPKMKWVGKGPRPGTYPKEFSSLGIVPLPDEVDSAGDKATTLGDSALITHQILASAAGDEVFRDSIGGYPILPKAIPVPHCRCRQRMVLFLQFDLRREFGLPFPHGSHVSIFMCPAHNGVPDQHSADLPVGFWKRTNEPKRGTVHLASYKLILHAPSDNELVHAKDLFLEHQRLSFKKLHEEVHEGGPGGREVPALASTNSAGVSALPWSGLGGLDFFKVGGQPLFAQEPTHYRCGCGANLVFLCQIPDPYSTFQLSSDAPDEPEEVAAIRDNLFLSNSVYLFACTAMCSPFSVHTEVQK